eukprot:scaffold7016_cov66-Phaeocystis_antarctica.AAC.3
MAERREGRVRQKGRAGRRPLKQDLRVAVRVDAQEGRGVAALLLPTSRAGAEGCPVVHHHRPVSVAVQGQAVPREALGLLLGLALAPHGWSHRRVERDDARNVPQVARRAERFQPHRLEPQPRRPKAGSERRDSATYRLGAGRLAPARYLRHRHLRVAAARASAAHVEEPGTHPVGGVPLVHRMRARAVVVVVVAARPRIGGDDHILAHTNHFAQELRAQDNDVHISDHNVHAVGVDELHEPQLHPQKLEVAGIGPRAPILHAACALAKHVLPAECHVCGRGALDL